MICTQLQLCHPAKHGAEKWGGVGSGQQRFVQFPAVRLRCLKVRSRALPPPQGGGERSLGPKSIENTRRRRRQRKILQGAERAEADLHCDTTVQFCGAIPPHPRVGGEPSLREPNGESARAPFSMRGHIQNNSLLLPASSRVVCRSDGAFAGVCANGRGSRGNVTRGHHTKSLDQPRHR